MRYRFKGLPFGVNVSQDVFQHKLDEVFKNIPNVGGIADDILIVGNTPQEHDQAFINMLEASRNNNVSLNSEKLQFKQPKIGFYGQAITDKGIAPAAEKLEAIQNIKTPTNWKELLSILGIVSSLRPEQIRSQVGRTDSTTQTACTKKHVHFRWEPHHQTALDKIKEEICSARVISYYDPDPATTTILQCDASEKGLGAWIRQIDSQGSEKIVAMASRSLTDTETRYSNIERERLGVMYGLEKYYLLGRHIVVETDHSPLEQIFKKHIADAPSRLQRILPVLRCHRFDLEVKYRPGKSIPVADALSRVCFGDNIGLHAIRRSEYDVHFITDVSCPINMEHVKSAMTPDATLNMLKDMIYLGWPHYRKQCPQELWDYWNLSSDLVLEDGFILKGDKIVIPEQLRTQVLQAIHTGHQGETKCILLARVPCSGLESLLTSGEWSRTVAFVANTNQLKQSYQSCSLIYLQGRGRS